MDTKNKSIKYLTFLEKQRDQYVSYLAHVGAKIVDLNDGDYNLDYFIQRFVPSHICIKELIVTQLEESQTTFHSSHECPFVNLDSDIVDALKARYLEFEKDFKDLLRVTDPDCDESVSLSPKKPPKRKEPTNIPFESPQETEQDHSDSHCLEQTLNPGELSKIFVQTHRTDVVNFNTDKPNLEDDVAETFYIYRSKHCLNKIPK